MVIQVILALDWLILPKDWIMHAALMGLFMVLSVVRMLVMQMVIGRTQMDMSTAGKMGKLVLYPNNYLNIFQNISNS